MDEIESVRLIVGVLGDLTKIVLLKEVANVLGNLLVNK